MIFYRNRKQLTLLLVNREVCSQKLWRGQCEPQQKPQPQLQRLCIDRSTPFRSPPITNGSSSSDWPRNWSSWKQADLRVHIVSKHNIHYKIGAHQVMLLDNVHLGTTKGQWSGLHLDLEMWQCLQGRPWSTLMLNVSNTELVRKLRHTQWTIALWSIFCL